MGAILSGYIATSHKMTFSLIVGGFFLIGGIANAFMLPAPTWVIVIDLLLAYIPMGWLGGRLVIKRKALT